jgi:hypothetical protein
LLKGSTQAVKDRITEFEEHFSDACRDIAAANKTEREDPPDISLGTGADAWTSSACKFSWYLPSMAIDTIRTTAPDRHGLYDFEVFVEGLRNTSDKVNMSSQSPKSHIAHGTEGASLQSSVSFDTDDASPEIDPQESAKVEIKSLRRKLQTLDNRLMMAEGRAQKAEQDVAK